MAGIKIFACAVAVTILSFLDFSQQVPLRSTSQENGIVDNVSDYDKKILGEVARHMKRNLNDKANPCEDFFEFACGGAAMHPDEDKNMITARLNRLMDRKLNLMFTRNSSEPTANQQRLRNLYSSCQESNSIEQKEIEAIRSILKTLGGFPAVGAKSGWIEGQKADWSELMIKMQRVGLLPNLIFRVHVGQHRKDSSKYAIYLDFADLGSESRYWKNKYLDIVKTLFPELSKEENRVLSEHIDGAVDFKKRLQKLTKNHLKIYSDADKTDSIHMRCNRIKLDLDETWSQKPYQRVTIESLTALIPQIDWSSFLGNMMEYPLNPSDEIFVYKPKAWSKLFNLIDSTEEEEIIDSIILDALSDFLEKAYKKRRDCVHLVNSQLRLSTSVEYVRTYFNPEIRLEVTKIVGYLQRELKKMISEANWIGDKTKKGALAKADAMISYVGYPNELMNETLMEQLHAGLKLEPDAYLKNLFEINRWTFASDSASLQVPFKSDSWRLFEYATMINAFYTNEFNSINILPGILDSLMYNLKQPNYINFAAIGFVIGHELSHAFDSNCIVYDSDGEKSCWWDKKTEENYKAKSYCIEKQYDGITFGKSNFTWVNGKLTLGENIADNIGLKMAYRAYKSWLLDQQGEEEPLLPGLNLDRHQLFWLGMSQFFCNSLSPEEVHKKHAHDVHSPGKLRVNIPMSNLVEFSEVYICPLGSPMNGEKKCVMW